MEKESIPDINKATENSTWLANQNLTEFDGQWIAVVEQKIIARDNSLKVVLERVGKLQLPHVPFYLRVSLGAAF